MILETSMILLGTVVGVGWWVHRSRQRRTSISESPRPTAKQPETPENLAPSSNDGLAPGDRVASFVLEEFLGEGGMASVFKAHQASAPATKVALKILKPAVCQDEQFRRRFDREVALCKNLSHPNIVRLVEWGDDNGRLYLALEYIDGELLTQRLSADGLPVSDVRRYMDGLIQGLNYAHQLGIVHRDLKPDNVMVTQSEQIKIMDFGLARAEDGDKVTMTGDSMGTPAYLPPEQLTGAKPTPAADQYSLGVILYEMLTGRRPFLEKNALALLMQHLTEAPPDPLQIRPELDPTCAAIALRMLEKSPESRFAALETVSEGLAAVEQGVDWQVPGGAPSERSEILPVGVEISLTSEQSDDDDTMGFRVST